ncbi:Arc family DNA-binding protein [Bradyrhizobium jicamae]|uniref:Arc family DNA-binding protein n=1 Tax=Bradyrhizobium jicamae TaxID=280332 RepID=A0ABS5FKN2_9BRAD|nr:Arc family DNA-binding protein [Bradyrhizobium jicamae]MBR0797346.1 Arc family DNA-binding protein [Bradyrhizobium jicamae]
MAPKKKQPVSAHDLDRIIIRLPEGMREKIAALAEANGRSMTAEVVAALEQHLRGPDRLSAVEEFIETHRMMLDQLQVYDLFSKDGILQDLDRLTSRVSQIERKLGLAD